MSMGLAGDGLAALWLEVFQGAHIVQPVGELDQNHAHVGDHGQQHLAHIFGLPVLAIGKLDLVDIGDAFDDAGHLLAESGFDLLVGGGRIFNRVVQQAGGNGGRVHAHIGQDLGHFERMNDVRLAGGPHLAFVVVDAELPGLADQLDVFAGAIGVDLLQECFNALVDGLLFLSLLVGVAHHRLRLPLRGQGRAKYLYRFNLPVYRHSSL